MKFKYILWLMPISVSENLYYLCKIVTLQKAKPRTHGTSLFSSLQPPMNLSYNRIKIKSLEEQRRVRQLKLKRLEDGKVTTRLLPRTWRQDWCVDLFLLQEHLGVRNTTRTQKCMLKQKHSA